MSWMAGENARGGVEMVPWHPSPAPKSARGFLIAGERSERPAVTVNFFKRWLEDKGKGTKRWTNGVLFGLSAAV